MHMFVTAFCLTISIYIKLLLCLMSSYVIYNAIIEHDIEHWHYRIKYKESISNVLISNSALLNDDQKPKSH